MLTVRRRLAAKEGIMFSKRRSSRSAISIALCATCALATLAATAQETLTPAEVVGAFNGAIDRGDRTAALSLMTRDATVLEMGFADRSRSDYEGLHLSLDIQFAKTTERTLISRRQGGEEELHWVASLYLDEGEFQGEPVEQPTAETVLLRRVAGRWRIAHLHWSSPAAPSAETAAP